MKRDLLPPSTALVLTPHPATLQGQRVLDARAAPLMPGETLATFLARHGVQPGQQWVVSLGGVEVPEQHWGRVRPKHGHLIEARRVPQQDVLRVVAIAVIAYYTFGAGGMGGGSFLGLTGAAGYVAAGVAFYAGSTLINRWLGPKQPMYTEPTSAASSPTYSLTGGQNRVRQFEPMALVLGEPYCVPDLAALPYTYLAGGEQYLWQVLHAGINCAEVSGIRIGQTPLESYQNVIISRDGFEAGNTGLALPSNVDAIAGAVLDAPTAPGPWVTRTSSPNTVQLACDVDGTVFAVNSSNGAYETRMVQMEIEYRAVGAPSWQVFYVTPPRTVVVQEHWEVIFNPTSGEPETVYFPGYSYVYTPSNIEIVNGSTKPVRQTYTKLVPAGQYEVRARKLTTNASSSSEQNSLQWTALKSYQVDNGSYAGQARLGLQVQATGQLNGGLDEVNWMGRANGMPYWNGSAWTTATTRANGLSNPGAQILLLARGIYDANDRLLAGLGWDDARIDIESLKTFMVWCAQKNFTFDYFLQETLSIYDLLDSIAAVGMGSISRQGGKLGVVWLSDEQPIESVYNMATTKKGSFTVDYVTLATANEIEYQYFDRDRNNTWKSLRVQAPGVTTPTQTARLPMRGVTTEAHGAVLARFAMGQNVYQRKSVTQEIDLEHLTLRRGTVLAMSHDLTQWGHGGRLRAAQDVAGVVTLELDNLVPDTGPAGQTTRFIGLRLPGETQYRIFPVQAFIGPSRQVTLDAAWPGGVDFPGADADNPAHDTLWCYDFKATPGQRLRVVGIEPQGNLNGARVTMVPESDEFWTYVWTGAYTPPANNSLLQGAPVIDRVLISEELKRQGASYYTEITASLDISGQVDLVELRGAVTELESAITSLPLLASSTGSSVSWRGALSETWLLELRARRGALISSPYVLSYTVRGLSVPPADVLGFRINGRRTNWLPNTEADLAGYVLRWNVNMQDANSSNWGLGQPLHEGFLTETVFSLPPGLFGSVVLMLKAVDTSGNESVNVGYIYAELGEAALENVLFQQDEHTAFSGTKTGCAVISGELVADGLDQFWGASNLYFWGAPTDLFWKSSTYGDMRYEWEFEAPDGGVLLLQSQIEGAGQRLRYGLDSQDPFWGMSGEYFWGADADPFWGTPLPLADWPGALNLTGAQNVRFQLDVQSAGEAPARVLELSALLSVPTLREDLQDVLIPAGGARLALTTEFRTILRVLPTLQQDGGTGVGTRLVDKDPGAGPLLRVVDGDGVSVDGLVDAVVEGY